MNIRKIIRTYPVKPLKIRIVFLFAFLIIFSTFSSFIFYKNNQPFAKAAWYNDDPGWSYRQKIQISSSSELSDFQAVLDEGEVGRWKFDEGSGSSVADVSGNSNTGTITNATWTSSGKYSNGLSFSGGNSEKITISNHEALNPGAPLTISMWVKYSTCDNRVIFEKNGNSGFSLQCVGGKLTFWTGSVNSGPETVGTNYNDNDWHHVVAVISGSGAGNGKIYVDGIEDSTGNDPSSPSYGTNTPVYIGSRNGTLIFNGQIDEARIYNRALSVAEITYLYNNNISPKLQEIYNYTQESGEDLRFTTSDLTTNIPYWIENFTASGQNAKIWLKVPNISNGTTDIYAYFGNPEASPASSGTETFSLFDDFDDLSNWTQSGSTISVSGGIATLDYGSNPEIYRDFNIAKPFTAEVKYRRPSFFRNRLYLTNTSAEKPVAYDYGDFSPSVYWNGAWTGVGLTNNQWYIVRWDNTDNNYTWKIKYLSGNQDLISRSHGSAISNLTRLKFKGTERTASDFSLDWVRIRKYAASEPTLSLSGWRENGDSLDPLNPTEVTAKSAQDGEFLNASSVYNHTAPFFDWPIADDPGGATDVGENVISGVAGYYSYFGTSCGEGGADPTVTRGLFPEIGGVGIHYSANTGASVSTTITDPGTYCLRLKTMDNAGNIQDSAWEAFTYQFDNVAPNPPSYIAANPSGYTSTDSFSFSWPVAADGESTPEAGVSGYQYKRGDSSGDSWSETQTATSVSGIKKYQDGINIFQVRSVDSAQNISSDIQTSYYYVANAPSKPTSLAVSPDSSLENQFSFSWNAPVHAVGINDYGYSINAWPTASNIVWTGSSQTELPLGAYATQQGVNIIYLVAKDEAGNYAFDVVNVAEISFECDSPSPPPPTSVAVTDSSNRSAEIWSLTLKWKAGEGQNTASFDHYEIYRSTNNNVFSKIASVSGTSYIDAGSLTRDTTYYYYIKAVDNANQSSAISTKVSRKPTGKYLTPPSFVSAVPSVTTKAGEATIKWVTDRNSSSMVRFGTDRNNLEGSQGQLDSVTDHSVTVKGLKSNTTYYYQVQSLDEIRDYSSDTGYSGIFSFATTSLPSISNVTVSNITLSSADITWDSSVATNHQLKYGNSINYNHEASGDPDSYVTKHSIKLEGLSHSTTYHFKIFGLDSDNNQVNSDDYVFETQKMPKISYISYTQGSDGPTPTITVEWKTNVPTSSAIEYLPKNGSIESGNEESEASLVESHKLILKGLTDNTEYIFYVSGRDQFGNEARSDQMVLRTSDDKRPPKISDVFIESSNVGIGSENESKFFVSWKTDEPAISWVEYGEGVAGNEYTNNTKEDLLLTNNHLVIATGLKQKVPHHMRVCSKDKSGNASCSPDNTVMSGEVKESVLNIVTKTFKKMFGWLERVINI